MTPTERQAAIIADLEARVTLLTDDLFYARASIARMSVELEEQVRLNGMGSEREARLLARVAELERETSAMRTTSRGKEKARVDHLKAENSALREERDSYRLRAEQNWGLRKEIQSALNVPSDCCGEEALKRGLAAIKTLRADKERLDWLSTQERIDYCKGYWLKGYLGQHPERTLRAAIDAAGKEAQP